MNTGFLKLVLALAMSLAPLLADAQSRYGAATFANDESEPTPAATNTRLQSAQFLNGDITAPDTAYPSVARPTPRTVSDSEEIPGEPEPAAPTESEAAYPSVLTPPALEPAPAPEPMPMPEPTPMPAPEPAPQPIAAPMPAPAPEPVATTSYETPGSSYNSARPGLDTQSQWQIRNGERLSDVIARWATSIGWQTAWEPEDLIALADLQLNDSFSGAITKVVDALNRNGANVQAQFYAANRMLRIMARK